MGLLGVVARTAVISGTATAVSNNVSRRQYNRWADEAQPVAEAAPQQAIAPVAAAPATTGESDLVTQLKELASLKDQGILTEEEFAAQKAKLLG